MKDQQQADFRGGHVAGLAATAVLIVSAFMPWASARAGIFSVTVNGTEGDGVITMLAGMALAIVLALNVYHVIPCMLAGIVTFIAGAIGLFVAGYDMINISSTAGAADGVSASMEIGIILTFGAGAALMLIAWMGHHHPEATASEEGSQ